jgi:hypothetical protein
MFAYQRSEKPCGGNAITDEAENEIGTIIRNGSARNKSTRASMVQLSALPIRSAVMGCGSCCGRGRTTRTRSRARSSA